MNQQQYPMQPMANQMAQYGRYGDSMMVHMNPIEVQGIAALSPTGQLTRNPVTGQPEAFLPFLAPLLGSMLGKTVLAKSIPFLAGKSALAGAIGSGLATTAVTGDVKKGLLSGITGFGLGKALGAASDALNPEIASAKTALEGAESAAAQAGVDLAKEEAARTLALSNAPTGTGYMAEALDPNVIGANVGVDAAANTLSGAQDLVTAQTQNLEALRGAQTIGQDLSAPFRQPGAFAKELIKPMNLAAVGVGEGQSAALDAQRENEERNRAFEREEEAKRQEALANIEQAYTQLERDYPDYQIPRGAAAGGIVSLDPQRYTDTVNNVYQLAGERPVLNYRNGGTSAYMSEVLSNIDPANRGAPAIISAGASARQAGLRGSEVISPEDLEGYRPGFDPEISYFRSPTPVEEGPPAPDVPDVPDFDRGPFNQEDYIPSSGMEDYGFNPMETYGEDFTGVNPQNYNQLIEDIDYREGRGMFGRQGLRQKKELREMNEQIADSIANQAPVDLFAQPDGSERPIADYSGMQALREAIGTGDKPSRGGIGGRNPNLPPQIVPGLDQAMEMSKLNVSPIEMMPGMQGGDFQIGNNANVNANPLMADTMYSQRFDDGMNVVNPSTARQVPIPDEIIKAIRSQGIGAAGFDQGGITSLTQENLNPRMPSEEAVVEDNFSEVDMGAMSDTMNANGQALIDKTVMAIAGRLPEDESQMIINEFIEQFGPEAFAQLRDRVLTEIVPNAQTQGEIVGAGGGMDDMIPGMIGDQQRVAVSPGEYIVPADVVSGIGDGSTDAGVDELDQMLDRVREERTGMTRQPPKLASAGGVLPA